MKYGTALPPYANAKDLKVSVKKVLEKHLEQFCAQTEKLK